MSPSILAVKFILLAVIVHYSQSAEYKLIFSHVVYRHGDRAPSGTFPLDKYQEDAWPMGWGHLTPKGIREQYELGSYLRRRYENFLSTNFSRTELYVRSSDRDRALESAQSNLAGLYSSINQSECNQWSDWKPIPIHTVPKEDDHLLQTDANKNCPAYQKVFTEQSSEFIAKMNAKYQDLFTFLMNVTELTKLEFMEIGDVFGSIYRERLYGWQLPDWVDQIWDQSTNQTVYEIMEELKRLTNILEVNTPEKARLMSGYLLGDIIQRMKQKATGKLKSPTKMVMYSAHDGTVTGLLYAMNVSNHLSVPYTACLIIELHESMTKPNEHFVTIHFRNDSTKEPFLLKPPACHSNDYCPLDVFEKGLKSTILYPVSERSDACVVNGARNGASTRRDMASLMTGTFLLIFYALM